MSIPTLTHATTPYPTYHDKSQKLKNGLTFWVLPNKVEPGQAYLSVAVNVGALNEEAHQYGFAHFLEHVAFLGTESFEPGEIKEYLESIGVHFGADLNASTDLNSTIFKLKIPTRNPEQLEKGVKMLYEMVFRMRIAPDQVEKERRVIKEEIRQRKSLDVSVTALVMEKMFGKAFHPTAGTNETLNQCNAEELRNFYKQWYSHPELIAFIAVGDFNESQMENWIKTYFGQASPSEFPTKPTTIETIDTPPQFFIHRDKECTQPQFMIIKKIKEAKVYDESFLKKKLAQTISIMGAVLRLQELSDQVDSPVLAVVPPIPFDRLIRGAEVYQTAIIPKQGKEVEGLLRALQVFETMNSLGCTNQEMELIKSQMQVQIESSLDNISNTPLEEIAKYIIDEFISHPVPTLEFILKAFSKILPSLEASAVAQKITKFVKGKNTLLLAIVPENDHSFNESDLVRAIEQSDHFEIPAANPTPPESKAFPTDFPPPGKIDFQQDFSDFQIKEIRLSNGMQICLKVLQGGENTIYVNAIKPWSVLHLDPIERRSYHMACEIASDCGIANFTRTELLYLFKENSIQFPTISSSGDEISLNSSTYSSSIEKLFQILHLKLSDLSYLDSEDFERKFENTLAAYEHEFKSRESQAVFRIEKQVFELITSNHPISRSCTVEDIKKISLEKVRTYFRQIIGHVSDFQFSIVGDFEMEEMEKLVVKYLGSLSNQCQRMEPTDSGKITFSPKEQFKICHFGKNEEQSSALLVFPSYEGKDQKQFLVKNLMHSIIESHIINQLRMTYKVYSPSVKSENLNFPYSFSYLYLSLTTDPKEAETIIKEAKTAIRSLLEPEQQDILKQLLQNAKARRQNREPLHVTAEFWLGYLSNTFRYGFALDRETKYLSNINGITIDDIKDYLRNYFIDSSLCLISYPEGSQ